MAPRTITLIKMEWDTLHVRKLLEASSMANTAHVAAFLMEEGIAHLFLVGKNTSKLKAKIEKRIPKKKNYN